MTKKSRQEIPIQVLPPIDIKQYRDIIHRRSDAGYTHTIIANDIFEGILCELEMLRSRMRRSEIHA